MEPGEGRTYRLTLTFPDSGPLGRDNAFRSRGADRRLPSGGERRIALKLTRRAVRTLKRALHHRGRVAVVVSARVRGTGGARTVARRIVLKRAARTR